MQRAGSCVARGSFRGEAVQTLVAFSPPLFAATMSAPHEPTFGGHAMHTVKSLLAVSLGILALTVTAGTAQAAGGQAGQIAFVGGKVDPCRIDVCPRLDLVRSVSPHGSGGHVLAKVR